MSKISVTFFYDTFHIKYGNKNIISITFINYNFKGSSIHSTGSLENLTEDKTPAEKTCDKKRN